MTRVAAIDQGTTSTRCLLVEEGGAWRLSGSRTHAQFHPHAGWVEQDPEELLANIRALLAEAGPIDAIALANQGESCLAWDAETGLPLSRVISWQDARTAKTLASRGADYVALSKQICGLPLDPYFSASKLAWLLAQCPAVQAAHTRGSLRLGTTDAFFLQRLTGTCATDLATASRTGLLDLSRQDWSEDLCALHGVPRRCLPPITSVDEGFGTYEGVPVKVSIVDQQAALYGHGCRAPGDAKITFGTGAFLLAVSGTGRPPSAALLPTVAWRQHGHDAIYAVEAGVYDAGSAIEWARRLHFFNNVDELTGFDGPMALRHGLVFVPAFSGLAAPHWDRNAAPLFIGMTPATDRRDMTRAILEGVALMTANLVAEGGLGPKLSIDGGLSANSYFAQILASACGRTIVVPDMHELTALGLAELCGLQVAAARQAAKVFEPDDRIDSGDRARFANAVDRARAWRT